MQIRPGYGRDYPYDLSEKNWITSEKTSIRKRSNLFSIPGMVIMSYCLILSYENVKRCVHSVPSIIMEYYGCFPYHDQDVYIDGIEKCSSLIKDYRTKSFLEKILDDLVGDKFVNLFLFIIFIFFMFIFFFTFMFIITLSIFSIPYYIYITKDRCH
ncbi:hypothetical protein OXIME_000753 [Oxyplasma meridianum]|uniref:Uncharacterized protein n=1 Tax=Oxyplasma meridianum TaxID=3073602 RepID=A0AAX4NFC2_9ARCH